MQQVENLRCFSFPKQTSCSSSKWYRSTNSPRIPCIVQHSRETFSRLPFLPTHQGESRLNNMVLNHIFNYFFCIIQFFLHVNSPKTVQLTYFFPWFAAASCRPRLVPVAGTWVRTAPCPAPTLLRALHLATCSSTLTLNSPQATASTNRYSKVRPIYTVMPYQDGLNIGFLI